MVTWEGEKPEIGETYIIELEVEGVFDWGIDITLSRNSKDSISNEGQYYSLNGVFESVDDDGYAVLRMGDYIIPFIAQGRSFIEGSRVSLRTNAISAYPVIN